MKEIVQNKKVMYILVAIIIIAGIVSTYIWKTNVGLEHVNHIRIDLYIGKEYNMEDIKQISKEVFGNQEIIYQKIETFGDSIAIHVKEASDEQLKDLQTKMVEKYQLEDTGKLTQINHLGSVRIRDMIKPYIIPMIITTVLILGYVGIRYLNLGIFKTVFTLLFRLILGEAVVFSIIEIIRIPVGMYTMPFILGIYIVITIITIIGYEKSMIQKKEEDKKK